MSEGLSSWASKIHVKPIKNQRTIRLPGQSTGDNINKITDWVASKMKTGDEEIVIRASNDLSRTTIAALPQDR